MRKEQAGPKFAPARVEVESRPGGIQVARSPQALGAHARHVGEWLWSWAERTPDRLFLAERNAAQGWREVTYAQAATAAASIGQALLDRGLSAERPVVMLSDNGIDLGLLQLGAMLAGIPTVPVSSAYSLMSKDFKKLKYIIDLVQPGLLYASDGRYAAALGAVAPSGVEVVLSEPPPAGLTASPFSALLQATAGPKLEQARGRVGPDTVAKILFTSGSTGEPKGVINTQRMLCANQQALAQLWPFLEQRPPVLVDWLPWNHTFGGNHNFNLVLRNGGTLYLDNGKPAPGLIEKTVKTLGEISPTVYFNVPRGYDMLLPFLERDEALRDRFFRELDLLHYAAAALPRSLWERLEKLSIASRGTRMDMVSAWGSTETAPMATAVHYRIESPGNIGLPAPGTEIKLVPEGAKRELRVKGPNVTPGYWKRPDLTAAAFDPDGFFKMGDAGRWVDEAAPEQGLAFDGRTAEDFKLTSGTWVHVGALRIAVIAAGAPVIQDAVVTGHDRNDVGLLVFPSLAGCRSLCPEAGADAPLEDLVKRPAVREKLLAGLAAYNEEQPGNSTRVTRVLLMPEPANIDAGEITDKGYINQRAVLGRRATLVERLYGEGGEDVLLLS
ncbi:MAG TPA: feruloyl-CoA synthase [Myxococcaceae bacterium]|nr:feruloyl-CoA synthase [Myxococcaceae bacterium]